MQLSTHLRRSGLFLALLIGGLAALQGAAVAQSSLDGLVAGREYIIAFPDTTMNTFDARFPNTRFGDRVMIHLYSAVDTRVQIVGPNYNRTITLPAAKFRTVDLIADTIRASQPIVTESGVVSNKTFRITAEQPILVTCFLLTRFGTEAWVPLPVDFWGTEYYAAALPGEVISDVSPGGEFDYNRLNKMGPAEILIIAAEDDTRVTIVSNGQLHQFPGLNNVVLNRGQAYQVQSFVDTMTANQGTDQPDLGGSRIFATKRIGVISGNTRAQVIDNQEGLGRNVFRNMLVEWLSPVQAHGTEFVYTPTWDARRRTGQPGEDPNGKRQSESIRVYGSASRLTGGYVQTPSGRVQFEVAQGKFFERVIAEPTATYIRTTQPAQVMMNSTGVVKYNGTTQGFGGYIGAQYDGWGAYMTELVPVERWSTFAPYFVSSQPGGMEHYINVVTDSIHVNDIYMENGSRFLFNRGPVPGTRFVWGTMAVTPGIDHWLEGSNGARFSGHVYGLYKGHEEYRPGRTRRVGDPDTESRRSGSGDETILHPSEYEEYLGVSYGYPLTATGEPLDSMPGHATGDSIEITTSTNCPDMTIRARVVNPNPSGIRSFELQSVNNVRVRSIDTVPGSPNEWIVVLTPIDPSRDASAVGVLSDRTGKRWRVEYSYVAQRVQVDPAGVIDFGQRTNEDEASRQIVITNPMSTPVEVRDVRFALGNRDFSVMETNPLTPATLAPGAQMDVAIFFSTGTAPTRDLVDTLLVRLGCYDHKVVVRAHIESTVGVDDETGALGNLLHRNDPNPFSGSTKIRFTLGRGAEARLDIYSMTGEKIATPVDGYRAAGEHVVTFDATALPAGLYYYRLTAGSWSATEAMVVR